MSDEQGTPPAMDLSECERQLKELEACSGSLSPAQRQEATALKDRLCCAAWPTAEECERVQVLVLRLALLLGQKDQ
jgi:hypothetical protein